MSSNRNLLGPLFCPDAMQEIFSDRARVQGMLDFEAALARAEAHADVIPAAAATAIGLQCRAERFDIGALALASAPAGNPAIPLVKALTALVAKENAEAARYVHWGATSQDVMDTGLVLQMRAAFDVFDKDLAALSGALAELAGKNARLPLAGRTWLQQALPITFGLKAAGWLGSVERDRQRLCEIRPRALALQFGGAAGTLAALGTRGADVATALAKDLHLALPDLPWHAQRDRLAEVATTLGLLTGSLGKMARDVSLLMQTEVGEAFEPAGKPGEKRGGSSTMPQKRNPVSCAIALSAAVRVPALVSTMLTAMVQEHERGLGGWHAEWETLPEIFSLAAGALAAMAQVMSGLELDPERMAQNLDATRGLILAEAVTMALAAHLGKEPAHALVEEACRTAIIGKRHLRDVLAEDSRVKAHLSAADLTRLLDPSNYTGLAETFVQRVLAARTRP
jgi:3-carboxy-cis,cis-muconate cycloisomerase